MLIRDGPIKAHLPVSLLASQELRTTQVGPIQAVPELQQFQAMQRAQLLESLAHNKMTS